MKSRIETNYTKRHLVIEEENGLTVLLPESICFVSFNKQKDLAIIYVAWGRGYTLEVDHATALLALELKQSPTSSLIEVLDPTGKRQL